MYFLFWRNTYLVGGRKIILHIDHGVLPLRRKYEFTDKSNFKRLYKMNSFHIYRRSPSLKVNSTNIYWAFIQQSFIDSIIYKKQGSKCYKDIKINKLQSLFPGRRIRGVYNKYKGTFDSILHSIHIINHPFIRKKNKFIVICGLCTS